jgi:hypothetical protein
MQKPASGSEMILISRASVELRPISLLQVVSIEYLHIIHSIIRKIR